PSDASRAASDAQSMTRRPPSVSNCFGPPKRDPVPAATTIVHTAPDTPRQGSISSLTMAYEDVLAATEFFAGVSREQLAELEKRGIVRVLVRGDVLFDEGAIPDELFVVLSGRIAIASRSIDGRESVFALMEAGDLFGEMGLLDGLPRSAE